MTIKSYGVDVEVGAMYKSADNLSGAWFTTITAIDEVAGVVYHTDYNGIPSQKSISGWGARYFKVEINNEYREKVLENLRICADNIALGDYENARSDARCAMDFCNLLDFAQKLNEGKGV